MKLWKTDEESFQIARTELYTAVMGDIMDKPGHLSHFFLRRFNLLIRP